MTTNIEHVTPVDDEHEVVSVSSCGEDRARYRREPCKDCPWRRDAVGEFPAEAFRISAKTAYDMAESTFGCHASGRNKPAICAGFLLKGSNHNLRVRMALMTGRIELDQIGDGGHALFDSYREMAEANGVPADDPVLSHCRDD